MSPVHGSTDESLLEDGAPPPGNAALITTTGLAMPFPGEGVSPPGARGHSFRSTLSALSNSSRWMAWDGASSRRWEEDQVGSQSARWSRGVGEPSRLRFSTGLQQEDTGAAPPYLESCVSRDCLQLQEDMPGMALHRSQHQHHRHLDGHPQAQVEGRKQEVQDPDGTLKAQGFQLQPPQRQRQQLQALRDHGEMIHEILSGTAPAAPPPQAHGRTWRLGKARGGGGKPTSPLNILVAQRGAMKEHLGRFLLDASKLEVGEVVATGASGEVRRGRYEGKDVAIKILKAEGDQSMEGARLPGRQGSLHSSAMMVRAEFRQEVLALMKSAGNCEQLLPLVGVTVDIRQRLCIVTRYMPGGTLHERLQRRRRAAAVRQTAGERGSPEPAMDLALPLPQLLGIATDVARGMGFLHENGILHRHLKSGNVFLESDGGRAVVGDLGVARLKGERGEMTKEVGTYQWMAPEVFGTNAWPVTSKSDVYSFAVLLWEMVTREIPYEGYTPVQAAVAVALSGLRPTIPGHCPRNLASLIERCWDMDPERRPEFPQIVPHLEAMAASQRMVGGAP